MQPAPVDVEVLCGLITCGDVEKLFNRSDQSIAIWRKRHGLPSVVIPSEGRAAVRYRLSRVLAWAKQNDREVDPKVLAELRARASGDASPKSPRRRRFAETPRRRRFAETSE